MPRTRTEKLPLRLASESQFRCAHSMPYLVTNSECCQHPPTERQSTRDPFLQSYHSPEKCHCPVMCKLPRPTRVSTHSHFGLTTPMIVTTALPCLRQQALHDESRSSRAAPPCHQCSPLSDIGSLSIHRQILTMPHARRKRCHYGRLPTLTFGVRTACRHWSRAANAANISEKCHSPVRARFPTVPGTLEASS